MCVCVSVVTGNGEEKRKRERERERETGRKQPKAAVGLRQRFYLGSLFDFGSAQEEPFQNLGGVIFFLRRCHVLNTYTHTHTLTLSQHNCYLLHHLFLLFVPLNGISVPVQAHDDQVNGEQAGRIYTFFFSFFVYLFFLAYNNTSDQGN